MKFIFAAFAIMAYTAGIQAAEIDLIGTYAVNDKGEWKEFLKVTQDSGKFVVSEKLKNGTWREAKEPLTTVPRNQFEKILKHPYAGSFDGLANKGVGIFKVPKEFQEGKFITQTGYFVFFAFGPVELKKL